MAQRALAAPVQDGDALGDAERLGDAAEAVTTDGRLTERPALPDADGAYLGWHALGAGIDGCPSLTDLAALGKRLYAVALPHDQAGVACGHTTSFARRRSRRRSRWAPRRARSSR